MPGMLDQSTGPRPTHDQAPPLGRRCSTVGHSERVATIGEWCGECWAQWREETSGRANREDALARQSQLQRNKLAATATPPEGYGYAYGCVCAEQRPDRIGECIDCHRLVVTWREFPPEDLHDHPADCRCRARGPRAFFD